MSKIHVLHVDDSTVIRGIIKSILRQHDDIEIIESAQNGQVGVERYKAERPDVVVMDIEMPVMDGMQALAEILEYDKRAKVIMCSTLTVDNADITMQAMKIGAIDYIAKPSSTGEASTSDDFRDRLVYLIKQIRKSKLGLTHGKPQAVSSTPKMAGMDVAQNIVTRIEPPLHWKAKILAIGSSTGGPQALFELMQGLKGFKLPIVITQHMPPTFTNLLAKHITDNTGVECAEAMQGMKLEPGKAVLAQGGKHMVFTLDTTGQVFVELNDDAPINFCKPAVDPMLESLNEIYDGAVMTAILTGMGHDGLDGVQKTTQSGGYCVAQNQETSIVWGMPGAVANAGLCSAVLPLSDMAKWIKDHI